LPTSPETETLLIEKVKEGKLLCRMAIVQQGRVRVGSRSAKAQRTMPRDPRVKDARGARGTVGIILLEEALLQQVSEAHRGERPRIHREGPVRERRRALGPPQVHRKRKIKLSTRLEHLSQPIKRHKITLYHHLIDPKAKLPPGLELTIKPMYRARMTTWPQSLARLVKGCILVTTLWSSGCRGHWEMDSWLHPVSLSGSQLLEWQAT